MPTIKLLYFPVTGKALCPRLILHCGGIPFEDFRFKAADYDYKNKTPFGQVPCLEVDGKQLCQTGAIISYASRLTNIDFKDDPWLEAKVMEIIDCCDDLNTHWGLTMIMPQEQKMKRRAVLVADVFPEMLRRLDAILGANGHQGFSVSNRLSAADYRVFTIVDVFKSKFIDGFPADLADKYSNMIAIYDNVLRQPGVKDWMNKHEGRSF